MKRHFRTGDHVSIWFKIVMENDRIGSRQILMVLDRGLHTLIGISCMRAEECMASGRLLSVHLQQFQGQQE